MMTLDKFEKEVIEEINLFVADWKRAQSRYGTNQFPHEMWEGDWWDQFIEYDRNMPYSEKNDV